MLRADLSDYLSINDEGTFLVASSPHGVSLIHLPLDR
jgi:hypothetical protein